MCTVDTMDCNRGTVVGVLVWVISRSVRTVSGRKMLSLEQEITIMARKEKAKRNLNRMRSVFYSRTKERRKALQGGKLLAVDLWLIAEPDWHKGYIKCSSSAYCSLLSATTPSLVLCH